MQGDTLVNCPDYKGSILELLDSTEPQIMSTPHYITAPSSPQKVDKVKKGFGGTSLMNRKTPTERKRAKGNKNT
jgi:hypothetical protein